MSESKNSTSSAGHTRNRRRALLVALLGAGAPLSQRVLPGEWVAPVVNSVMLPAHAQTSQVAPVGDFGPSPSDINDAGSSLFENIVERTEEEILELFVRSAEAANTCAANSSCDTGTVDVQVVASINDNPSSNQCVQARVLISGGSCSSNCLFFDFDASVDGQSVTINDNNCDLSLTGMSLTEAGLSGNWSYVSGDLDRDGSFDSPRNNGGGCGSLGSCA